MGEKDTNGNVYVITLYESYLSKAILDARRLYQDLFIKIAVHIGDFIQRNSSNASWQRLLYSAFSLLKEDFPSYDSIDNFIEPAFNVFAAATFHKIFFELLAPEVSSALRQNTHTTLASSLHTSIANNHYLLASLRDSLKPNKIFPDHKPGRKAIDTNTYTTTRKLGITTENNAIGVLQNFFDSPYVPGQNKYYRQEKAVATAWLEKNKFPFVSGISGTVGVCYCGLVQLGFLSTHEIRTYLMVLSATLVARGHHSFGELHPIIKKIGFRMEVDGDIKSYYQQYLTKEFIDSKSYEIFLEEVREVAEDIDTLSHRH